MIMAADPLAQHIEAVAVRLLGQPNRQLSTSSELRFGSHGSLSVDLEKGTYFDHEAEKGGGVLDLIGRETGLKGQAAANWLRDELGADLGEPRQQARIVATYDYVDEAGEVLFQVVRYDPKTFRQRRPDGRGWSWSVKGVRQVPYRLPELLEAIADGKTVFVVEGEKDADALWRANLPATCNAGGAGKWSAAFAPLFAGADVVILPDNDDAGHAHRDAVAASLRGVAASVRSLELPGLPPKGDVSDFLMRESVDVLRALVDHALPCAAERPPSRFGAIAWADLDSVEIKQDFLVEDLLFTCDVGMIYGASGCGKSFLAVDMGLSVARGVPFLGKKTRQGSVIYQAGEGGSGLVKRLKAYRLHNRVLEDVPFILLPERVDLFGKDGNVDAFVDECLAWSAVLTEPLSLVVIDTFSTATPGANENASEDMSRALQAGERINKATGAALIYVHHKNAAGDRERGHTSLRANISTAIEVTRDEDTNFRSLRLTKLKDGEDGLKIGFDLQPLQIGSYDDGKPITSCVVVPAQDGDERTSKRPRLAAGQRRFLKVLEEAIHRYGGIVPPNPSCDPDQVGVSYGKFRDLYVAICGAGMEPGAIRTAISRDGNELWLDDLIGRDDHWLWITAKGERRL
jgi:hypothetical protein